MAVPAQADVLTVSNTNDAGPGSLRDAIATANGNGSADTIQFVVGLSGPITLTTGQLAIASDIDIQGPGARVLTVSGNHASRVFRVDTGAIATIAGLTVADGSVSGGADGSDVTASGGAGGPGGGGAFGGPGGPGAPGGSASASGSTGPPRRGGGIENSGTLTLREVTLTGNDVTAGDGGDATATGGAAGAGGAGGGGPLGGTGGPGGDGGTATATGGTGGIAQGGAVYNSGTLTIQRSTVSGNSAAAGDGGRGTATGGAGGSGGTGGDGPDSGGTGGDGGTGGTAAATGGAGGEAQGGAIYNGGALTIQVSTVSGDVATPGEFGTSAAGGGPPGAPGNPGSGAGGGSGGAGRPGSSGTATRGPRGDARGGGIFTGPESAGATFTGLTLTANAAPTGANLENRSATSLQSTVVSDPRGGGQNCQGAATSGGHNIDSDSSCGVSEPSDQTGVDPQLGPLQDNGGPTNTHALPSTSPAVDRGVSAGESSDQRGVPRPSDVPEIANAPGGDGTDAGSFEIPAAPVIRAAPDTPPPQTPDTTAPTITRASLSPRTWAVDPKLAPEVQVAAKRAKRSATFTYFLSEPARVVYTIEHVLPGRKVGRTCRKPTRSNRKQRKCNRYKGFGRFAQEGAAGRNSKRFAGRISRKTLRPGNYRVALVATDLAGNKSSATLLGFRIVRR